MRARIKELALDLFIQHGYRGVSFGDIAKALNTTRANIHYHFGNKQMLAEEVLADYCTATSEAFAAVWRQAGVPLIDKIAATVEYSRKRYLKFNAGGKGGRSWSLIASLRQNVDDLTPKSHDILHRFERNLHASIVAAIEDARRRGEFVDWMPVEDVALQLVSIANSAAPITQDARDFARLEQLYMGFARIIAHAFGTEAAKPPAVVKRAEGVKAPKKTAARRPSSKQVGRRQGV
jgi:AcrR family transcriptional regulator